MLEAVIRSKPMREVEVTWREVPRLFAASDAALEEGREGFAACLPPTLYDLWSPGDRKIAQLEMQMVQYALVERAQSFRGRRGIWYIDNVASLMGLVRARSDSPWSARSISCSSPLALGFTGQ